MQFGEIPIDQAKGAILAHSIRLESGTLRKGRLLQTEDLVRLRSSGVERITAARLEEGDLGENEAALRIASALTSPAFTLSRAATGRVHLRAASSGLLLPDAKRIGQLNRIDEALTLATAPAYEILKTGQLAATVKVITFGVPEEIVARCVALTRGETPLISLKPFQKTRIGFLQTTLPGLQERVLDKARSTMIPRLAELSCRIDEERRCPHSADCVVAGLRELVQARCDIILVICATAVVDRRDILPRAITEAGGRILRLGIPVDPGHLTLYARLAGAAVLGLPGSARSPRLHGFDGILRRLAAGLDVSADDLAEMGVGGLLKESPHSLTGNRSNIGGIILAAGQSRRMGSVNKMLAPVDGEPMVRHVVHAMSKSRAQPVIVVLGYECDRVRAALQDKPVRFCYNPDHAMGMSTSLRTGLDALPDDLSAAVVALGDMPRITANDIDALIDAYDRDGGPTICAPVHKGHRGNPVLWDRRYFGALRELTGDEGARQLIEKYNAHLQQIPSLNPGVLLDLDTPDALEAYRTGG